MAVYSRSLLCLLLWIAQSTFCYSMQVLNQTGTLTNATINTYVSATVSLTCPAICGNIIWHINGRVVTSRSHVDGLYEVHDISSVCSASPVGCPQCGCSNCNNLKWPTSQTYNSTLTMAANESVIVDCMSEQIYSHTKFSVLRKRYNFEVVNTPTLIPVTTTTDNKPPRSPPSTPAATSTAPTPIKPDQHSSSSCSCNNQSTPAPGSISFREILIALVLSSALLCSIIINIVLFIIMSKCACRNNKA